MRQSCLYAVVLTLVASVNLFASQITIVVDQQNPVYLKDGGFGINLDNGIGPLGRIAQVFTPSTSALDVFSFFLQDANAGNGIGLSVYVEIMTPDRSHIFAESRVVTSPDGFGAPTTHLGNAEEAFFLFDEAVALTPGTQYAARLQKVGGDRFWVTGGHNYGYSGGYYLATNNSGADLFFREGLVVPEPSSLMMCLGALVVFFFRGCAASTKLGCGAT